MQERERDTYLYPSYKIIIIYIFKTFENISPFKYLSTK